MERGGPSTTATDVDVRSFRSPVKSVHGRALATPARAALATPARRMHPIPQTPASRVLSTPARAMATPARAPAPPVRRLVIHKLVLQDFKSYAGRQEIGPFHKSFSSIVGPNGSGKSNVIDALLFVFGWRANKMRQGRLSELIHNREGAAPPAQCIVEVWFREIVDFPDTDAFDVVPGSELIIARTALRNNTSQYTINGQRSTYTDVGTLLRGRGIDLDHKRFLILQGEVESIAQMPPKARTEHDEGLLEYLEDLIGTSSFKAPIDEMTGTVDAANEARSEKLHRLKIVQRELDALEPRRREAEQYLRDANALTRQQSRLWQAQMLACRTQAAEARAQIEARHAELAAESAKNAEAHAQHAAVEAELAAAEAACTEREDHAKALTRALEAVEKQCVELGARAKLLGGKRRKLAAAVAEATSGRTEARAAASTAAADVDAAQRALAEHEAALAREQASLEQVCEALRGRTQQFSDALQERQRELAPWTGKLAACSAAADVAREERTLLAGRGDDVAQREDDARASLAALRTELQERTGEQERLRAERAALDDKLADEARAADAMRAEGERLSQAARAARRAADEARQAIAASTSRSEVLASLSRQAELGLIGGFYGRLGALGAIDETYDVAISTACPGLHNMVVETVEDGQACIEHLRKHSLGRAHFILLRSLQVSPQSMAPIDTPEGVPRLYDLVTPKDARFAPAFYHQLGDTLVAHDLVQANRIAYGAKRWRVVTLDGQLIDKSGTMSGGGTRVARGAMGASLAADVTPEQVGRLAREHEAADGAVRAHAKSLAEMEALVAAHEARRPEVERRLALLDMDVRNVTQRISDAEDRLHEVQAQSEPDAADRARIAELDAELARCDEEHAALRAKSMAIEEAIQVLQEQILEAGGVELRTQQGKVENTREMLALAGERLERAERALGKAENDARRFEKALGQSNEQLAALDAELGEVQSALAVRQGEADAARAAADAAREEAEEQGEALAQQRVALAELAETLRAFRALELEVQQACKEHERTVLESEKREAQWAARHSKLVLHEVDEGTVKAEPGEAKGDSEGDGSEDDVDDSMQDIRASVKHEQPEEAAAPEAPAPPTRDPRTLPTLSDDELRGTDLAALQTSMDALDERLQASTANLDVLDEFRRVEEVFLTRARDLEAITVQRDEAQQRFEALRKERLERFMAGFTQISLKLKEMYQTITLGGNAELELVDSLDPFSEGIVFSVMPPKKTWKNICNLSGGEKTLSSLALVFALHAYKPTPLYVMDEIDAALDFRNVSIIANIIKERTRGAQFVVISLRNNMFELSARLVGVYKTGHCTKSLTIENADLHVREAPAASPQRSPTRPA